MSTNGTRRARRRPRPRPRQQELDFRSWGGPRRGAGRKPRGQRAGVPHVKRAPFASRFPVHVTARLIANLPTLREPRTWPIVRAALRAGSNRFGLRLVHFSVQRDHLHLLIEARDRRSITRGLQGLFVRLAKRLNRWWGRKGRVFADRFHDRILRTPREVRNALRYVLLNARRHRVALSGIDPYSSGAWFDGWASGRRPSPSGSAPVAAARTWLATLGWRRWRLIAPDDVPGPGGSRKR